MESQLVKNVNMHQFNGALALQEVSVKGKVWIFQ